MKKLNILLIIIISPVFADSNIFDKMDKETAVTTGIYKLSQSERTALLEWLNDSEKKVEGVSKEQVKQKIRSGIIAENKQNEIIKEEIIRQEKTKNMGFSKEESEREEIHSSIVGEFKGWQGKNIFKLANGQIWKQAEKTSFYIPKRTNPKVTIKPKSLRTWALYVDGFGRGVKVKRIK
ncbi:MAG: hypothetical protein L3J83_12650 [Proteobacteria bacterium]|nr:hypothetical protein [Pseudomonadota bacterium]